MWVNKRRWNMRETTAITGFWDGNAGDEGSGCGVAGSTFDRGEEWFAESKIALTLITVFCDAAEIRGCDMLIRTLETLSGRLVE